MISHCILLTEGRLVQQRRLCRYRLPEFLNVFQVVSTLKGLVPYLKNLEQNEKNSYSAFLTSVGWTKYSRMTNAVTTTRRPSLVKKYL